MAKQPDILGLFTGISNKPIDPTGMTESQQRSVLQNRGLLRAREDIVNALGKQTAGQKQQTQRADYLANFDNLSVEEQKKAVYQLQAAGETAMAGQLASRVGVKASEEMVKNFANKTTEEKKNIINVLRSQGRTALAGQLASQMSTAVTQAQAQERLDIQRLATEQRKTELGRADLKYIRAAEDSADKAATIVPTLLNMANEYSKLKPTGGFFGTAMESWKDFVGGQDAVSRVKTKFDQVQNSNIIASLPPGVASDKDIAMASKGFMDSTWNPDEIEQYLRGQAKMSAFLAEKNSEKAKYVSANGGDSSGFRDHWDTVINQEGYKDVISAKYNLPAYDIPKAPVQFNEDKVPVGTPTTSGRQANPLGRRR